MRLIDADALIPMMKYATTDSEIGIFPIKIGFDAIVKVIDEQPTIEPEPQIVRCKDCEYGIQDEDGWWYCRSFGCQVGNEDGSGFCADAERRE